MLLETLLALSLLACFLPLLIASMMHMSVRCQRYMHMMMQQYEQEAVYLILQQDIACSQVEVAHHRLNMVALDKTIAYFLEDGQLKRQQISPGKRPYNRIFLKQYGPISFFSIEDDQGVITITIQFQDSSEEALMWTLASSTYYATL